MRTLLLLAALALPIQTTAQQHTPGQPPPNVLLMISDDQGLDARCYGNEDVHTPAIDKLASEGVLFTHAFAAVSSCSPSRATLLTGMHIHASGQYGLSHGTHNQHTRREVRALPRILGEAGYRTGVIGKYHLSPDEVYPFHIRQASKPRDPDTMGRHAREFIEDADTSPFFLVMGFTDPHRAGGTFPKHDSISETSAAQVKLPPYLMDLPDVRRDYTAYLESVNNLDRCVASVLQVLDDAGATTNTLIIFLSDNGMPFQNAKTNLYDAGIRMPLIVRAPGASATEGTKCDAMASWVDIAPTILDWAGIDAPKAMQGTSLVPVIKNPEVPHKTQAVFASHLLHEITMWYPMRAVRTRDHKLIWNIAHQLPVPVSGDINRSPSWKALIAHDKSMIGHRTLQDYLQRPEYELYDLRNDPDEMNNLATQSAHSDTLTRMQDQLHRWMRLTKDPWTNRLEPKN